MTREKVQNLLFKLILLFIGFVIQDHTDHGACKERAFRRALIEFQKVRYFKTYVCTWVIELFPEWLVLLHGLLASTIH